MFEASPTPLRIISAARDLASEDGENPEYDRALVELASDLLGISSDDGQRHALDRLIRSKG